jgi:hypothetical protein
VKDATTDSTEIREWLTKWPGANVGIATGATLVIDQDDRQVTPQMEAVRARNDAINKGERE